MKLDRNLPPMSESTTDFGFQRVPIAVKQTRVGQVFDSVSGRYDLMNDLMSLGLHRYWKRFADMLCLVREGESVLDLAGGTGDLAMRLAPLVGERGQVVLADINSAMIEIGRCRVVDAGMINRVSFAIANAEQLPFPVASFDCIAMAFGLRNVTDKKRALASMYTTLKPGGRLVVLEFSALVIPWLRELYDGYSFRVLPWLGERVAGDADSYRYLAESIRMHPDQETLCGLMHQTGFERVTYHNLLGGVAAVHKAYKF